MPDRITIEIRPAQVTDDTIIKTMIRRARLDPTSLKWKNFLIAEHQGQIVGIGQVKPYPNCNELGSLVTVKEFRGQGIAGQIIAALEAKVGFPLYLLCESSLKTFYEKFGYQTISWWDAPNFLKLKLTPTFLFRLFGIKILVMKKDIEPPKRQNAKN